MAAVFKTIAECPMVSLGTDFATQVTSSHLSRNLLFTFQNGNHFTPTFKLNRLFLVCGVAGMWGGAYRKISAVPAGLGFLSGRLPSTEALD